MKLGRPGGRSELSAGLTEAELRKREAVFWKDSRTWERCSLDTDPEEQSEVSSMARSRFNSGPSLRGAPKIQDAKQELPLEGRFFCPGPLTSRR